MEQNPDLGKKQRIKDLAFWRDLYLEGLFNWVKKLPSPATGKPFGDEERRSELNRRIPAVKEMVALADITALRDWITIRKTTLPFTSMFWNNFGIWKDCESVCELRATS